MKKSIRRAGALLFASAICFGALAMFAGCTTNHPEVTITYTFNGVDYEVDYKLSRVDAPQTVQHFIELADAGYYDGMCVHDYNSSYLYTGGYRLVDENEKPFVYGADNGNKTFELREVDYLSTVKELEKKPEVTFTQYVWYDLGNGDREPLYAVRGECSDNGQQWENGRENYHYEGALVMYYTPKGDKTPYVDVTRNDGGKGNDVNKNGKVDEAEKYDSARYALNSTTSLFYTFMGETNPENTAKYCVFGRTVDFDGQMGKLQDAIAAYKETLDENASFTTENVVTYNRFDYFADIRSAGLDNSETPFQTPMTMPIIVKSVKVTKY